MICSYNRHAGKYLFNDRKMRVFYKRYLAVIPTNGSEIARTVHGSNPSWVQTIWDQSFCEFTYDLRIDPQNTLTTPGGNRRHRFITWNVRSGYFHYVLCCLKNSSVKLSDDANKPLEIRTHIIGSLVTTKPMLRLLTAKILSTYSTGPSEWLDKMTRSVLSPSYYPVLSQNCASNWTCGNQ